MNVLTNDLRSVVLGAQAGDPSAWTELVERFQDFAVAVALGYGSDWDAARDVAQEAFTVAFMRLDQLREPEAFPGWFAALVRTACGRRARRPDTALESVGLAYGPRPDQVGDDPLEVLVAAELSRTVRAAVEALPEHERTVVALHYLADLDFAEISRFLGVKEGTARKRAHSARQRLKELEAVTIDSLSDARPSAGAGFRDELLLFMAIGRGDAAAVGAILARSPELTRSSESWSWSESVSAGLGPAQQGTPLVRAVESGSLAVLDAVLAAGAPVDEHCHCAGAETPLWTAVVTGQAVLVKRLLKAGANPNAVSFSNSTALHAAGQRHPDLMPLLLAAGADPELLDGGGRTAGDWAALNGDRRWRATDPSGALITTGIRVVDLCAPLARGSRQFWPPAVQVGQRVLPFGIADALGDVHLHWIGFEHGGFANPTLVADGRELDVPVSVHLVAPGSVATRRAAFIDTLVELSAAAGEKLVVCVSAPEHRHEVTLALHALSTDPTVLSTIVIDPYTDSGLDDDGRAARVAGIPEGFDTVLCFDAELARVNRFPAVDPLSSQTTLALDERHQRVLAAVRALLSGPPTPAAEQLRTELTQRLRLGEVFGAAPGELTSFEQTLTRVEALAGLNQRPPTGLG